ncbi:BQ2448_3254 [Microbotryum intermedium]|uniref:BQ2448_3254 protein n=1 Tax=Microbotryum intermedium TaxID=269621 RepID=A0A238FKS2_9BASI|nr:BQ2448_3254 [Microbotryum intermedium]
MPRAWMRVGAGAQRAGHDCLEGALRVVPEALLSREVNLRDALLSLVGKVDGKSPPQPLSPTCSVFAIIDGSTMFRSQCTTTTYRAKHNVPKRHRLFLNAIVKVADQIIAATAKQIKLILEFYNATYRPVLKQKTVLVRQAREQQQKPQIGTASDPDPVPVPSPVPRPPSPVPVITIDSLAACVYGLSIEDWSVDSYNRGDPTQVANFVRWTEDALLVVAAHEADPLISASTRFRQLCGVALDHERTVLMSADSDFFMLLGDQARHRTVLSEKRGEISLLDLALLEAHPANGNSDQGFVASLIFGCDCFDGIKGVGPAALRALIMNVEKAPTAERIDDAKSLCAKIGPSELSYPGNPARLSQSIAFAYAPIRRYTPLVQEAGVSSTGPLPAFTRLSDIQDPKVQRAVAAARRRQAEQPTRSTSTRKLALQGTVHSPDYHLLEPEYEDDGKNKAVPKASKGVRERIKATTAKDLRATSSSGQPGGTHSGDRGFPGGSVYRMSTLTSTLDDMVREVLSVGENDQVPHRLRRPRARTTKHDQTSQTNQTSRPEPMDLDEVPIDSSRSDELPVAQVGGRKQ